MIIYLYLEDKLLTFRLPNQILGSYSFDEYDEEEDKLINIDAKDNNWILYSTKNSQILNGNNIIQNIVLKPDNFYVLKRNNKNYLIYTTSSFNNNNTLYKFDEKLNLIVGNSNECNINYQIGLLNDCLIKIHYVNNVLVLEKTGNRLIYINKNAFNLASVRLNCGTEIDIYGLRIYIFNNMVLINNPANRVKINVQACFLTNYFMPEFQEPKNIEIKDIDLYNKDDYFLKSPRIRRLIETKNIKLTSPPKTEEEKDMPLILTLGPMFTMGIISVVTLISSISKIISKEATIAESITSLITAGAMLLSMLLWPLLTNFYNKKIKSKKLKESVDKYETYLEEKRKSFEKEEKIQRDILNENLLSTEECFNIIKNKNINFWNKRIDQNDFLNVRIGKGNQLLDIKLDYQEDDFILENNTLREKIDKMIEEFKYIENVPIGYSFYDNPITAIMGNRNKCMSFVDNLLLQLLSFYTYEDLKIVLFTDSFKKDRWEYIKYLNHNFDNERDFRFFSSDYESAKTIMEYLTFELNNRLSVEGATLYKPHYFIVVDGYDRVKQFDFIKQLTETDKNLGFTLVIIEQKIGNLPSKCSNFITIGQKTSGLLKNSYEKQEKIDFIDEVNNTFNMLDISKYLANIPIEFEEGIKQLPNAISFLEMEKVGKVEQLNILNRWNTNDATSSLKAEVGVDENNELIYLDLHEKFHGPHGLIAGMTGSGKSEFIITYILSLAINYSPDDVEFILIDYKGGGLAFAFENKTTGMCLPHLAGTITNLDKAEMDRTLVSIDSEIKRRQKVFNDARDKLGESTIDIYKYQKMYRAGLVKEPVSHLFIISDEFAELKNQQPEFMEQLISTARIGRSLGVHLILATQKPSGVVDPQIWSNTRFRICMKVQDKSDSNEVIKCPDAAFLKQTGRFYFQVGYNEVFVLGQAAWAGGKYIPSERYNKTIDTSIDFINPVGYIVKSMETKPKNEKVSASNGEELLNIVKYLSEIANQQNIKCRPLWLEKIPREIRIEDLAIKYNYQKVNFIVNPIVGEYDVPSKQEQRLLTLPLTDDGNTLIYGATGSGKENFIITLIYSSMLYYTPEEINYYIIDFGSGALNMFSKCPIVGDILKPEEEDKVENLYKMIKNIIDERKKLFSDFGGDYQSYLKNSGKSVPNLVIIINNYESYQELYEKFEDELTMLTRECNKYGIYFIFALSTPNGLRFKLKQNFALTYVLQQNNEDDYVSILGSVNKNYPAKIFGRGIIKTDSVYEFQTAFATDKDNITKYIKEKCNYYSTKYDVVAKKVPVLPNTVIFENIYSEKIKENELLIGLNKNDLSSSKININKNYISLVTAMDLNDTNKFINNVIKQMIRRDFKSLLVINAEDYEIDLNYINKYQYVNKKFDSIFDKLYNFVNQQYETYESNNYDKSIFNNIKPLNCIIIGINSFKNKLSSDNQDKYSDLFIKAKDLGIINFIIVDSINEFKSIEYDNWYKNTVDNSTGIWIGNGINDQFSLKINQKIPELRENDVPESFCFVIHKGKPKYVKYIEKV